MVDVKNLCMHAKMAAIGMFVASIVLYGLIYLKEKKKAMHVYMSGIRYALLMIVLFVSMLAIYALCDFYDFWMNFHYLFFDNDLFILDPNTSIMINMFPETFFFDLVMLIMATYVISVCVIYFVLRVLDKKVKI